MVRLMTGLLTALVLAAIFAPAAAAQKPFFSCPAEAAGWVLVDRDVWWDRTVAGFEEEGFVVYDDDAFDNFTAEFEELAVALGFASAADLEQFVRVEQWAEMDRNANDLVCMKVLPATPGLPAYFFGGIDDAASTPRGQSGQ